MSYFLSKFLNEVFGKEEVTPSHQEVERTRRLNELQEAQVFLKNMENRIQKYKSELVTLKKEIVLVDKVTLHKMEHLGRLKQRRDQMLKGLKKTEVESEEEKRKTLNLENEYNFLKKRFATLEALNKDTSKGIEEYKDKCDEIKQTIICTAMGTDFDELKRIQLENSKLKEESETIEEENKAMVAKGNQLCDHLAFLKRHRDGMVEEMKRMEKELKEEKRLTEIVEIDHAFTLSTKENLEFGIKHYTEKCYDIQTEYHPIRRDVFNLKTEKIQLLMKEKADKHGEDCDCMVCGFYKKTLA